MTTETQDLFTATSIAKALDVPDTKVKAAIKTLKIEPASKKGCRVYYTADNMEKIKASLG